VSTLAHVATAAPAPPPRHPPADRAGCGHGAGSPWAAAGSSQSGGRCALRCQPLRQQPPGCCHLVVSSCTGCVGGWSVVPASPGPCASAPGSPALTPPANELVADRPTSLSADTWRRPPCPGPLWARETAGCAVCTRPLCQLLPWNIRLIAAVRPRLHGDN
jgi:hypothetical protein